MKGDFWGIGSVILITLAQLCLKAGVTILAEFKLTHQCMDVNWLLENLPAFGLIFIGLIGYVLSMVCWLFALKFLALSKAYPLISLSYVLVYLFAVTLPWFNESATLIKFFGVVFILLGIWIISRPEVTRK
ncbi:4-amino-4-deoxy-L-arabinose-phosphoundecaprenol flippase subunit ArnF [Arsenophonus endosymbiont of Bemisia tabaci]|uniref:4-amino-4-deoxy-L-arabinose-phosphoundecaprenol flippase subunit ArnF n=1 Tax=Arsenophonus endosymbiont of Bemisia tabaci TaxID=536059 RepID=UPI0015F3FDF0|nr:4-amino-4-deoxy-L-arabinose-phosphoundecaprenol flippase subunit ArnF [Arsenophonus endosymbiont of Bemisia tabaci]CAA2930082.1 putative 4-amino-4-deoxy-L-arabinose-phosphoundecaprenol flippase subunit ArnF [Arsenophonus endosymbiont of Bemisia tabaci Q2]